MEVFQPDGGKFTKTDFIKHFQTCGILHQLSCPGTPEQNGVVEYGNIVTCSNSYLFMDNPFATTVFLIKNAYHCFTNT